MTTFEEISTCPKANYDFWTARAKTCLSAFKFSGCKLEKHGFRASIRHRRDKTYLDSP